MGLDVFVKKIQSGILSGINYTITKLISALSHSHSHSMVSKNTFKIVQYSVLCCLHYMTLCGSTLGSGSGEAERVSLGNLSRITQSSTPVHVFACFHQHWTKLLKLLGTIGNGIIKHIPNFLPVSCSV